MMYKMSSMCKQDNIKKGSVTTWLSGVNTDCLYYLVLYILSGVFPNILQAVNIC